jgi:hypothetical protein
MRPLTPINFTNPYEVEILKLEQDYAKAFREGKGFEELKAIREKIKLLKSELSIKRDKRNKDKPQPGNSEN